jgi:hypothetical protein
MPEVVLRGHANRLKGYCCATDSARALLWAGRSERASLSWSSGSCSRARSRLCSSSCASLTSPRSESAGPAAPARCSRTDPCRCCVYSQVKDAPTPTQSAAAAIPLRLPWILCGPAAHCTSAAVRAAACGVALCAGGALCAKGAVVCATCHACVRCTVATCRTGLG